ncbi:hypothetical protein ASZ78_004280 [Callipepla squamata]|uniref:S-formylglutathione hydrolase n=1 Tax=Callipepla squamata TaxID=9009 RepID=A0A226MRR6_CALSU|nr:hypothetical protein ASZ78_004280 [Callipepla squamata]
MTTSSHYAIQPASLQGILQNGVSRTSPCPDISILQMKDGFEDSPLRTPGKRRELGFIIKSGVLQMVASEKYNTLVSRVKAMALKQVSSNKCFEGFQKVFEHDSTELKCKMKFGIYLPPKAETGKCPVLYWLSGLTCTEQNFITKAGFQQAAAEHGLIVVAPDTSPRGCNIEGEDESWDFGTGAGFYVDATEDPWKTNYRMYSYVKDELPKLINANFPTIPERMSVFGHSMGGHGALILALKNPGKYKAYDATQLVKSYPDSHLDILIDQGKDDQFLSAGQLLPDNFIAACTERKIPVVFRLQQASCFHSPCCWVDAV